MPDVDPTISAALISGGVGVLGVAGTAITAWVGSRNTRLATERTVAGGTASTVATLAAAREDRLWEKRAAAYEETVAGLLYRRRKRKDDLRMYRLDQEPEQQLKDFFSSYEPPGWFEARTRLIPYASDAVLDASNGSEGADQEVWNLYRQWLTLVEDNKRAVKSGSPWAAADDETMIKARREVNFALEEAETQDQALIKVIRDELRSKPEAAIVPVAPSWSAAGLATATESDIDG
jgi:hypothetical protein